MSKRYELVEGIRNSLISSAERDIGRLLCLDLAYSSMELSTLRFMREDDRGVEEGMEDAKNYLPAKPPYRASRDAEKAWREGINRYNSLARFYRNMGLNVKDIVICKPDSTPDPRAPFIRLILKRALRKDIEIGSSMQGLSTDEIEKEILRRGLAPQQIYGF